MPPKYDQHYRSTWESIPDFKGWLKPVSTDSTRAYCMYCKCEMNAKITDIKKHGGTGKHKKNARGVQNQRVLTFPSKGNPSVQLAEGSIALFIAEHCSLMTTDHLVDLLKASITDSGIVKDIKMHRTKCTNVIKNVLAPHFKQLLRDDIGNQKYCLIIDETTDIAVVKQLGVVIRYFSSEMSDVKSTFLGLVDLEDGTAPSIVSSILKMMQEKGMEPKNLVGIGVDNAQVNTGVFNGVHAILKEELALPHLVMIKCVCHSLQLAVSHASKETLPRNIDFLLRETYKWFSHSSKRTGAYKKLFAALNPGEENLKIPKMCDTRWLSIYPAVSRILDQWDELKLHFDLARSSDNCYMAEILFQMYSDDCNKLYLLYLRPLLFEVQQVNKSFESNFADPCHLLEDLMKLFSSVSSRIILPTARVNLLEQDIDSYVDPKAYLGYEFEVMAQSSNLGDREEIIRKRCIDFTIKLVRELRQRLPDNVSVLKQIVLLSVSETLRAVKSPITDLAVTMGSPPQDISQIENQWRSINLVQWENTKDTVKFWAEVAQHKNASGENPFANLLQLALTALSLPHSNAEVERVFSLLKLVKSPLRNKLFQSTLEAILHVRCGLKRIGKNCHSYKLPSDVIKSIGTMIANGTPPSEEDIDIDQLCNADY